MSTQDLSNLFDKPSSCPAPQWFCPPGDWSVDPVHRRLEMQTDRTTDFWQKTHYGFQADNGHFLFTEIQDDFALSVHVRFQPVHQYDQSGLMVRLSSECWLKTSVEYELEEPARLGVVVTNAGFSDWSTQDVPKEIREIWLRIQRKAGDALVEASMDGRTFSQIRLAHLLEDDGKRPILIGPYACSPKGPGYAVAFDAIAVLPPDA